MQPRAEPDRRLEDLLKRWREEADLLARYGHREPAGAIRRMAKEVENAAEPYLRWLVEDTAMLKSGRSESWLRARFQRWEAQGHARVHAGRRSYRDVVIPQRDHYEAYRAGLEYGRRRPRSAPSSDKGDR